MNEVARVVRIVIFFTVSVFLIYGCSKDSGPNSTNTIDEVFMATISWSNNGEINLGNYAVNKAEMDSVSIYGDYISDIYTLANLALDTLGKKHNLVFNNGISDEYKDFKTFLSSLSGHEFDTAYINNEVKVHENFIKLYNDEINNGHSKNVVAYAQKYLPHIQKNYAIAQSLQNKLK